MNSKALNRYAIILLIISLILISVFACKPYFNPEKPYVIIHKFPASMQCNKEYCGYKFIGSNGVIVEFCEDVNKYSIGDTIK